MIRGNSTIPDVDLRSSGQRDSHIITKHIM